MAPLRARSFAGAVRSDRPPVVRVHRSSLVITVPLLAAALLGAPGCAKEPAKSPLTYTEDAKRAYDAAMVEFEGHNWLEAQALLRDVKKKYSYSKYARMAELRLADADFEQEKFSEALRGYRQCVHDHRSDDEDVTYARARITDAEYKQIGDSFLLPAGEERDQAMVLDAYKELKSFLHDYPDAKQSSRVRGLLAGVISRLIRHELAVAKFYLQRDEYESAVARVRHGLASFSDLETEPGHVGRRGHAALEASSGLEAEALVVLGETYLKLHRWADAREVFDAVIALYAETALSVQAKGYLDYMARRGV